MPLFESRGVHALFVHIPKTGGTSVIDAMRPTARVSLYSVSRPASLCVTPQHIPFGDLRAILGSSSWDYACSVVRNPYDRLESEFKYRSASLRSRFGKAPDFGTWVLEHLRLAEENPNHLDNHLRPQTEFIDEDVELFRYEDGLEPVIAALAAALGVSVPDPLSVLNTSEDERIEWTMAARLAVNGRYRDDFRLLDYALVDPEVRMARPTE